MARLVGGVKIGESVGNFPIDVLDRIQHALAEIALLVAVTQFHSLMFARGRAAGNDCTPDCPVSQMYFGLDGRVSARVQHFPGMNFRNISHGAFFILQLSLGFGQVALENVLAG